MTVELTIPDAELLIAILAGAEGVFAVTMQGQRTYIKLKEQAAKAEEAVCG